MFCSIYLTCSSLKVHHNVNTNFDLNLMCSFLQRKWWE